MKIAIIGGGISGLVCALRLGPTHEVTLFESDRRLGGHAHTITAPGTGARVDTGFIVYNEVTYPRLTKLFSELGVATQETDMGLSVRDDHADFEYSRDTLGSLFAQKRNLARPGFHRMLAEALRFNREAAACARTESTQTVSDFFGSPRPFSQKFLKHYFEPLIAAIWSADRGLIGEMPMAFIARFFDNHGFLRFRDLVRWRVVTGGSSSYVDRLAGRLRAHVRLGAQVRSVSRVGGVTTVRVEGAEPETFDKVIFASHADQALQLLEDPTSPERELLGAFRYGANDSVVHSDTSVLPRRRRAWASWNYRVDPARPEGLVTYHMNTVQRLSGPTQYCVSLSPGAAVAPELVHARIPYTHPIFVAPSLHAQKLRASISGPGALHKNTFYAGAYWYNGFHEDGMRSALDIVSQINGEPQT